MTYQADSRSGRPSDDNGRPLDFLPQDWGPKLSFPLLDVALTRINPGEISFNAPYVYFLVLLTPQPAREIRFALGEWEEFSAASGTIEAIPANTHFSARWKVNKENIIIGISEEKLSEFVRSEFAIDGVIIQRLPVGQVNERCHRLASLLGDAFVGNALGGHLYKEALATALLANFIQIFLDTAATDIQDRFKGGLTLRAERMVREYININYANHIGVNDLAQVAGLSYSHFLRAFRQSFGSSPSQVLRELRLRKAEELILRSDLSMKDVARLTGFASQSHMITTMKSVLGYTPGELRRVSDADIRE